MNKKIILNLFPGVRYGKVEPAGHESEHLTVKSHI